MRFLLILIPAMAMYAQNGSGVNLYSLQKETQLGEVLAADIQKNTTPLLSTTVREYVDALGARLAGELPPTPQLHFNFVVIAQPAVAAPLEPLSLPGGYIFIPANLILTAQGEAEFASTLAHAMAHVAARHGTRAASRGEIARLAAAPFSQGGNLLLPAVFIQFSKEFETEADVVAVNIAARSGFDPEGLERYIGRVGVPPEQDRVQVIQQAIAALRQQSYSLSPDFARIQEEVRNSIPPQ